MEGIMASAATGVMNSLLTKLTTLLGEEYKLQEKAKRDVAFLKDELSSMNALLEKLDDTEVLDPQHRGFKRWRHGRRPSIMSPVYFPIVPRHFSMYTGKNNAKMRCNKKRFPQRA